MNKKIRSVIATICIMVLMGMNAQVLAYGTNKDAMVYSQECYNYICEELENYLAIDNTITYGTIKVSSPISVVNSEDEEARTYFVTNNDKYIGMLTVTVVNGQFYSSFMFDESEEIDNIIMNNIPFAMVKYDNALVFQTENNLTSISRSNSINTRVLQNNELSSITFNTLDIVLMNKKNARRDAGYFVSLQVPYVANASSPKGNGLCWAASIAAVSNYKKNTSYTAMDIYNGLANEYLLVPYGTPIWARRGYKYCGMSFSATAGMKMEVLYNKLSNNNPVITSFFRETDDGELGHSVVCRYFSGGDEYAMYGFMDPNFSNTVYVKHNDPTCNPDTFVYVDLQQTIYDEWRWSWY